MFGPPRKAQKECVARYGALLLARACDADATLRVRDPTVVGWTPPTQTRRCKVDNARYAAQSEDTLRTVSDGEAGERRAA